MYVTKRYHMDDTQRTLYTQMLSSAASISCAPCCVPVCCSELHKYTMRPFLTDGVMIWEQMLQNIIFGVSATADTKLASPMGTLQTIAEA